MLSPAAALPALPDAPMHDADLPRLAWADQINPNHRTFDAAYVDRVQGRASVRAALAGGNLVVECNNAVSLMRRVRVLLGRNNTNTFTTRVPQPLE